MKALPPKISSVSPLTWFGGVLLTAVALGIIAVVYFFDPSRNHFYPVCTFHLVTGWNCPGCGATRALFALLHGNFSTALRDNALFVFVLFGLLFRGIWLVLGKYFQQPRPVFFSLKMFWAVVVLAVFFGILRNLPGFEFLAP